MACIGLMASTLGAGAASVAPIEFGEILSKSDAVFLGTVVGFKPDSNDNGVDYWVTLKVERSVIGNTMNVVELPMTGRPLSCSYDLEDRKLIFVDEGASEPVGRVFYGRGCFSVWKTRYGEDAIEVPVANLLMSIDLESATLEFEERDLPCWRTLMAFKMTGQFRSVLKIDGVYVRDLIKHVREKKLESRKTGTP